MKAAVRSPLVCLPLLLAGCGGSAPNFEAQVDALIDAHNATVGVFCECADLFGYTDQREVCEDAAGYILQGRAECLHEAFAVDVEAAEPYVDCLLTETTAYRDCVDSEFEQCREADLPTRCVDDYLEAAAACGPAPSSIGQALEACGGNLHVGPPPVRG